MIARAAAVHEAAAGAPCETAIESAFGIGSHLTGKSTGAEQGVERRDYQVLRVDLTAHATMNVAETEYVGGIGTVWLFVLHGTYACHMQICGVLFLLLHKLGVQEKNDPLLGVSMARGWIHYMYLYRSNKCR